MKSNPYSRERKTLNSDMNVVPYIDVMLVLLVIFMVTAPMLTTGVDVDLPKQNGTIHTGLQMPVIITMKDTGELFITHEESQDSPITESALITNLSSLQQKSQNESGEDIHVMVRADQNNQYGNVMALFGKLQDAGISKVGLLTDSSTSSSDPRKDKNKK